MHRIFYFERYCTLDIISTYIIENNTWICDLDLSSQGNHGQYLIKFTGTGFCNILWLFCNCLREILTQNIWPHRIGTLLSWTTESFVWYRVTETFSQFLKAIYVQYCASQWIPRNTDSTKINRPGHNIHMYWTNFRQPNAHVQQNIFGKTLIEVRSPHLYASFGTFYAKIGRRFRNSSECLKTHFDTNNWQIWTQKVPKEA